VPGFEKAVQRHQSFPGSRAHRENGKASRNTFYFGYARGYIVAIIRLIENDDGLRA